MSWIVRKMTLLLAVISLLLLAACNTPSPAGTNADAGNEGGSASTGSGGSSFTLCVVHNNADHPSISAMVEGFDDEAAAYGSEIIYFDPAFDPQKQASQIEDCIAQEPDVISVNAVDPTAVVASLEKAYQAGIPVMMHNAGTTEEGQAFTTTFIGSKSYDQGYAVGQMMVEDLGPEANVVLITGFPGQTDAVNRSAGAADAWADAGVNYEVIAEQTGEWSKDMALSVMQDLLTRFPEGIDAVFAHDDPMALGALEAIKAADRLDEIKIYGVNGNKEACESVKNGEMSGTALQLSYLVGVYSVRAAYDITQGRLVADEILAPTAPVTAENIDQWIAQCW